MKENRRKQLGQTQESDELDERNAGKEDDIIKTGTFEVNPESTLDSDPLFINESKETHKR